MSRARHRARGGSTKAVAYSGGDSNVMKEAHERKRGGKVHHGEGEMPKARHDRPHRGRARGGRIGADKAPLTTAAKVKHVTPGEEPEAGRPSD